MSAFHIWKDDPPPRDIDVLAKYELLDKDWQNVHTCRRGCCVYQDGITMILPKYWKEVEQEQPHD